MPDRLPQPFERAYRVVAASFVVAILWDFRFWIETYRSHVTWGLLDSFFPQWMQLPRVYGFLFLLLTVLSSVAVVWPNRNVVLGHSIVTPAIALALLISPFMFARQLLVFILWGSVWLIWVSFCVGRKDFARSKRIGGLLPLVIVSFVFLGGFVGKLTADYWSGEAMYHLFFAIQDDAKFATLRETLLPMELSRVATWYSRVAILGEMCIAGAMLLPLRMGLPLALLMVIGMWIVSPVGIINALAAAVGLLFAGVLVALVPDRAPPTEGAEVVQLPAA
jgi:hypothetical protein